MQIVENGKFVSVTYQGTLENGDIFDTTEGGPPLEVQVGCGEVIKGFEDALLGMALNEKRVFTVGPENAYGHRDEDNVRTFSRKDVPPGINLKEGDFIGIKTPAGDHIPARVTKCDDDKLILDLNHPLADLTLTFEVEVVGISDRPAEEEQE